MKHPETYRSLALTARHADLIAKVLRSRASQLCDVMAGTSSLDPDQKQEIQDVDRALRCCPAISDIDRVWVRWGYWTSKHEGLTTESEVVQGKYPKDVGNT